MLGDPRRHSRNVQENSRNGQKRWLVLSTWGAKRRSWGVCAGDRKCLRITREGKQGREGDRGKLHHSFSRAAG